VGDGRTDDTAALRQAFRVLSNQAPVAHNTLYIPPGTYLVSETLQSGHSLDIQGAGSGKTVIKLRDKCPGFTRAAEPRAVWQVDDPAAPPIVNSPAGEDLTGISIYNLAIDTGKGNGGAKGVEILAHHLQRLEDLDIRSGDGAGVIGLAFKPQASSGALLKNVRIKGFRSLVTHTSVTTPAADTPDVPWGDIHKDWINVQKYEDQKAGEDWAPAIQAAIDSGAQTVYLPPGRYEVLSTVHLRGKIDRLFGLHSHIARGSGLAPEEPVLIFDEPNAKHALSIERLEIDGLRHTSPAALVLKDTNPGHYENVEGCGKVFREERGAADTTESQHVP